MENMQNKQNLPTDEWTVVDQQTVKSPQEEIRVQTLSPAELVKLGNDYYNGSNGKEKSIEKALEYYFLAAEQEDVGAQYYLGNLYYTGSDVLPQSHEDAFEWWMKAAKRGDGNAQINVGILYFYGDGVEEDSFEAMFWLGKALQQGYDVKKKMDEFRLIIMKGNAIALPPEEISPQCAEKVERYKQRVAEDVDAFIAKCREQRNLHPKSYSWSDDKSGITVYFPEPYPDSVEQTGFKEFVLASVLQIKGSIWDVERQELADEEQRELAHAFQEASWEVVQDLSEAWVADHRMSYCRQRADFYLQLGEWEKAEALYCEIYEHQWLCTLSQHDIMHEVEVEQYTDEEEYNAGEVYCQNLMEGEEAFYNAALHIGYCQWMQGKEEDSISTMESLITTINFMQCTPAYYETSRCWIAGEVKSEYSQEHPVNLLQLLKIQGGDMVWKFCGMLFLISNTGIMEKGIANGYDWSREMYEAIEGAFKSLIPYMEELDPTNAETIETAGSLHYFKGEYMLQTRRFALAEKEYILALEFFNKTVALGGTDELSKLLMNIINGLCGLYQVQRKTDKREFIQSLLDRLTEEDKEMDEYEEMMKKVESYYSLCASTK